MGQWRQMKFEFRVRAGVHARKTTGLDIRHVRVMWGMAPHAFGVMLGESMLSAQTTVVMWESGARQPPMWVRTWIRQQLEGDICRRRARVACIRFRRENGLSTVQAVCEFREMLVQRLRVDFVGPLPKRKRIRIAPGVGLT
jgi:hypothetical protein